MKKNGVKNDNRGILYSTGQLDCLSYYKRIFHKLKNFLKDREIATKIYIGKNIRYILKRGSKDSPLYVSDLIISDRFMQLRKHNDLSDVRSKLKNREELIWKYFVPRKLIEMHYACNHEFPKGVIDRVFIDIDKGKGVDYNSYIKVVNFLIEEINKDKELKKLIKYKLYILWTGRSIHLYLFLRKQQAANFYDKYFKWSGKNVSFPEKWALEINRKTKVNVRTGHERQENAIIFDTSGTPSGKLARCPYSLHLSSKGEIDGIAVPLKIFYLKRKNLIKELQSLTPDKVLKI